MFNNYHKSYMLNKTIPAVSQPVYAVPAAAQTLTRQAGSRQPLPDYENMSLREELAARYDQLEKAEKERLRQRSFAAQPDYENMSLNEELAARYEDMQNPSGQEYGKATAAKLDEYLKNYQMPTGTVRTGLVAPIKDMFRNYAAMKEMELKESDPFFHCKANYEAASRGKYGTAAANIIDAGKELWDMGVKRRSLEDSLRDYRANLRGQKGAWAGQSLQEACPTYHKYYN